MVWAAARGRGKGRAERARRERRTLAYVGAAMALVASFAALPVGMLEAGRARASECLEGYTEARAGEAPRCEETAWWLALPARLPWTRQDARLLREELASRVATSDYLDAAVGRPDPAALAERAVDVERMEGRIDEGSRRLTLTELGPTVGPADLGQWADLVGDRGTLSASAERFGLWTLRSHALEARLIEGRVGEAQQLAARYADFDPRDPDLREQAAALLCLGDAPKRGLNMLGMIQDSRAAERHEAWARDFGRVRLLIEACAARAGVTPGPIPDEVAGRAGKPESLATLRLATAPVGDGPERREALALLEDRLIEPGARVALLAEALAHGFTGAPADVAALAEPREGEGMIAPLYPLTANVLLDEPRQLWPTARLAAIFDAVDRLVSLADEATRDKDRLALGQMTGALLLDAATRLAREARPAEADGAMRLGAALLFGDELSVALGRSSALYVAGDSAGALARLDAVDLSKEAALPVTRAAALVQRAELLASLGRAEEAARAAIAADAVAAAAGDPEVDVHARFVRLALVHAARLDGALRPPAAAAPPAAAPLAPPWVGFADAHARWASPERPAEAAITGALAAWDRTLSAPAAERRAFRYRLLATRGDAPSARSAYLAMAAQLLPKAEGDAETWLDAFDAIDGRRVSLRARAFSRAEAARWRGDAAAAEAWRGRYKALVIGSDDPASQLIARALRL